MCYDKGLMNVVKTQFNYHFMEIVQYTPSCPFFRVRIIEVFSRNRHGGETVFATLNERLYRADLSFSICENLRGLSSSIEAKLEPLKNFKCNPSNAADAFFHTSRKVQISIESGLTVYTLRNSLRVTSEDFKDMWRFQTAKLRVRGFIKKKRGLSIHWGVPCEFEESENDVLELLEPLYNPDTDYFFCASRCYLLFWVSNHLMSFLTVLTNFCAMSKDGLFLYRHSFDGSNLESTTLRIDKGTFI